MNVANNFLEHYGIKGMRWGVRSRGVQKIGPSKNSKQVSAIRKKQKKNNIKSLTNKELELFNKRMELEKKYNTLNPNIVKSGKAAVASVLAAGVTVNSAIAFSKSPAGQAIKSKLSKG